MNEHRVNAARGQHAKLLAALLSKCNHEESAELLRLLVIDVVGLHRHTCPQAYAEGGDANAREQAELMRGGKK